MFKKILMLALAASFALAACGEAGIPVAYACEGTTDEIQVTYYSGAEGEVTETVSLPWDESFGLEQSNLTFTLLALNPVEGGEVSCTIDIDKRTVSEATAPGGVELTVTYSDAGTTTRITTNERGFSAESGPALVSGESELPANENAPTGSISFENATNSIDICELYVAPDVGSAGWGESRITDTFSPDDVIRVDDLPYDEYKIRVIDCQGVVVAVSQNFVLDSTLEVANINNPSVTRPSSVTNNSTAPLCRVTISQDGQNYSPNLLSDNQRLAPEETVEVLLTEGQWFIRVESCDGQVATLENLELTSGIGFGWSINDELLAAGGFDIDEEAANITVLNESSENICSILYANQNSPDWEANLISGPIGRDGEGTLRNVPRGVVDLKAETCGGEVVDWVYGYDITERGVEYSITFDGGPNMTVRNVTGSTLCALNVRPSGASVWQRDLLNPSQQVAPDGEVIIHLPTDRAYDLQAVSCDVEQFVVNSINAANTSLIEITP